VGTRVWLRNCIQYTSKGIKKSALANNGCWPWVEGVMADVRAHCGYDQQLGGLKRLVKTPPELPLRGTMKGTVCKKASSLVFLPVRAH
jgi:hypothetical protein